MASPSAVMHKGKLQRSWPQLPSAIIGSIAVHYVNAVYESIELPEGWVSEPALRESCNVYLHLRLATELEKLLFVCPSWHAALENHHFWSSITRQIDPAGILDRYRLVMPPPSSARAPPPSIVPTYKHFKHAYFLSCAVCRINRPHTHTGLDLPTASRRQGWCAALGTLPLCRDHRRSSFCGVCLREPMSWPRRNDSVALALFDNDDPRTFPHAAVTCRNCRHQALERALLVTGVPRGIDRDPEAHLAIEFFVEGGEGSLDDVMRTVKEKQWLIEHTRVAEYLHEAVATARYLERLEDAGQTGGMEEEEEEDELDEEAIEELAQPEHFSQARDMAATDWARTRILDGHWVSPGDDYYGVPRIVGPAEHPAPWTLGTPNSSSPVLPPSDDGMHPSRSSAETRRAPTYKLAHQLYSTFTAQMTAILLPALHNVAKRLLMTSVDAAAVAARMTVHDVLHELQQPYAWSKELDVGCCPPLVLPPRRTAATTTGTSPSASSSIESGDTDATSPITSASTLQTTPSPPPKSDNVDMTESDDLDVEQDGDTTLKPDDEFDAEAEAERVEREEKAKTGVPPPALDNMLRAIPYVPRTLVGLPENSVAIIAGLWREASAPLYHCMCNICVRARGAHYGHQGQAAQQGQREAVVPSQPLVQVQLPAAEEEEEDLDDDWGDDFDESDRMDYSDDAEYGEEMDAENPVAQGRPLVASTPVYHLQPPPAGLNANGKRPVSVAVDEVVDYAQNEDTNRGTADISVLRAAISRRQSAGIPPDATPPRAALRLATPPPEGTPPKRARLELTGEQVAIGEEAGEAQPRLAKRRSEDVESIPSSDGEAKRARVDA